jgi:hypothetical protein
MAGKMSVITWKTGAYDLITKMLQDIGPVGKKVKQMNAGARI